MEWWRLVTLVRMEYNDCEVEDVQTRSREVAAGNSVFMIVLVLLYFGKL